MVPKARAQAGSPIDIGIPAKDRARIAEGL
jgi:hypothetical protein